LLYFEKFNSIVPESNDKKAANKEVARAAHRAACEAAVL
jgi:hypothetical protein